MTLYNVENYKLLEATSVNYNTNLNSIFIFFYMDSEFPFHWKRIYVTFPRVQSRKEVVPQSQQMQVVSSCTLLSSVHML